MTVVSSLLAYDVPFERQEDAATTRTCGAAALSMVYRSLGRDCRQAELVPRVLSPSTRPGQLSVARTHLLARDAIQNGFFALIIQPKDPIACLKLCQARGIRVILNHRASKDVSTGHYTVLLGLSDREVMVHDPQYGPHTTHTVPDLLDLWRPSGLSGEVAGHVLVAITRTRSDVTECRTCRTPLPSTATCPGCRQAIVLQPAVLLGCGGRCPERLWQHVFCPFCDAALPDLSGMSLTPPSDLASDADDLEIEPVSAAIDEFCRIILNGLPGPPPPAVAELLAEMRTTQAALPQARTEYRAMRKETAADLAEARAGLDEMTAMLAAPPKKPAPAEPPISEAKPVVEEKKAPSAPATPAAPAAKQPPKPVVPPKPLPKPPPDVGPPKFDTLSGDDPPPIVVRPAAKAPSPPPPPKPAKPDEPHAPAAPAHAEPAAPKPSPPPKPAAKPAPKPKSDDSPPRFDTMF